jgi:hypothetical protein
MLLMIQTESFYLTTKTNGATSHLCGQTLSVKK